MAEEYLSRGDKRDNMIEYPLIANWVEGKVLEVGPAFGMLYSHLHFVNRTGYVGFEISQSLIVKAKEFNPLATFIQGDILNNKISDKSFDTVVCLQLLEHFNEANFTKALSELRRIAKDRIIISVPNKEMIPDKSHIQKFTYESLFNLLKDHGPVMFLPGQEHHILAVQYL